VKFEDIEVLATICFMKIEPSFIL